MSRRARRNLLHFKQLSNVIKINQILKKNILYLTAFMQYMYDQGCISCGILVSGIGARRVSSEHMENMEMFSCSPT